MLPLTFLCYYFIQRSSGITLIFITSCFLNLLISIYPNCNSQHVPPASRNWVVRLVLRVSCGTDWTISFLFSVIGKFGRPKAIKKAALFTASEAIDVRRQRLQRRLHSSHQRPTTSLYHHTNLHSLTHTYSTYHTHT